MAVNYATANNSVTVFPPTGTANYRVSQLVIPPGAILEGVSPGTYPGNESIACVSTLARLGGTNSDPLSVPDGSNYCRIRDIQVDGNQKNNTAGDGIHVSNGAASQEGQVVIERCYVHDTLATTFTSATTGGPTRSRTACATTRARTASASPDRTPP